MGKVMLWYLFWVTVSTTLVASINANNEARRSKRANTKNFDILLKIYKMNPLKESNIFKTFSNTILLPRPDERLPDLNLDSNESTKEKRIRMRANFKQIEDAIHVTRSKTIKRPSLNIQERISFRNRRIGLPTNDTNNELEIGNALRNSEGKDTKENASDINKSKSGDIHFNNIKIAHKNADIDRKGFDRKVTNGISFDNNGIAVLK